jgi:hypothetical protein
MKTKLIFCVLFITAVAEARMPRHYDSGMLLSMNSVQCGLDENSGKSFAGEVLGTDSGHKKTQEMLCPEYVLQTDRVTYRIRPKDEKHPVLLPVGDKAQFRIDKDKIVLRVEDLDDKERDYTVVSITPRSDVSSDPDSETSRK